MSERYPKTMSTRLFWQALHGDSEPSARPTPLHFEKGEQDVDSRVLRVLREAGGSATRFEVEVRTGVARLRSRWAIDRLSKQGLVVQRQGEGDHVLLRLNPKAWQLKSSPSAPITAPERMPTRG
jgi:hypothetical protein